MCKTELLAPAKDKETAIAAIDCGADAVYIGASAFGARKNAGNSIEDIKEVVNYAHKYWARVHVALNTILTDFELNQAFELVKRLTEIGVDAIIIQDMGLLEILMKINSNLPPLHMSTQCNNYLTEKVKFFNDIGVSRVILARELSIKQINEIHKENPDLELECFIHGALCVSMSGQCYLSQYIGGRSANRGECAQPCRKKYDVIDEEGNTIAKDIYPLCLKDFKGDKYIEQLKDAGICSFKIEGRLKDINYVKNVVSYYRKLLGKGSSSGRSVYLFEPNPEKSFNRGFTDYFLSGRENCFSMDSPKSKGEYLGKVVDVKKDYFVIDTDKKISCQDGLYFNDNGCLVNKFVDGKIYPNKKLNLSKGDKIYRNLDTKFEKEVAQTVKRQIGVKVSLNKFERENDRKIEMSLMVSVTDEDGVKVEIELPSTEQSKNPEKMKETFIKQFSRTGEDDFYIEDIKIDQGIVIPFMPVSVVNKLRRDLFNMLMEKRLALYESNRIYQKPMKYAKYYQSEIDYRGNVHNSKAEEFYKKCGVKVLEPSLETKQPPRQVELMRCKHCIKYALNMCKSPKKLFLRDLHNKIYPLKFNCKDCEMSLLSN